MKNVLDGVRGFFSRVDNREKDKLNKEKNFSNNNHNEMTNFELINIRNENLSNKNSENINSCLSLQETEAKERLSKDINNSKEKDKLGKIIEEIKEGINTKIDLKKM